MKYRKKPVVIEAYQWFESECVTQEDGIITPGVVFATVSVDPESPMVPVCQTLEGNMMVREGDWVIRGVKGEYYPCKPDIFEQTYEKVEE